MRRSIGVLVVFLLGASTAAAQEARPTLTVQQIMQDPDTWIGAWPQNGFWTEAGDAFYFYWNPQGAFPDDSLFSVSLSDPQPRQVPPATRRTLPPTFNGWRHGKHVYDAGFRRKVYSQDGDLYIYDRVSQQITRLTHTREREANPRFAGGEAEDGETVIFEKSNNLFRFSLNTGVTVQLTDLRSGKAPADEKTPTDQEAFLRDQQQHLFEHLRDEKAREEARDATQEREEEAENNPPTYYTGDRSVSSLSLDPTGRFVTFRLSTSVADRKNTLVQDYVTETGYAQDRTARPKVGSPIGTTDLYIQDLQRDTTYHVDLHQLAGSYDVPAYIKEIEPEMRVEVDSSETKRDLLPMFVDWNGARATAVLHVQARDNKDRWLALLDPATGTLRLLDRQQDDAWIGGPGISRYGFGYNEGWLPDNEHYFFQSERTGYSHLYIVNTATGNIKQLTDGDFEVFNPRLSMDGNTWHFTSSEGSPFERHFYEMPVDGGRRTRLTTMAGNNQVDLSPDEQTMGILQSYSNRPPEVFLQPAGAAPQQVTRSTTDAWRAYPWRDPEIIHFEASDGVSVPARIYEPEAPNGAAVLFVHGAGYLQNVHRWWSSYFREYMFHNLLADKGYTVLDVDYRASAGYGRDWRTAIYRHMGGRDLQDYVDASRFLASTRAIDPERTFIYGGSYGGFITLMALFTEPEHIGGGAALRSVTDWAHYNHGYTSNILNTPAKDSLAFARSSPIYFAEGLEDPLLIAHGMVDTNVHFQDVVRLAQRLIELGKEDWEMAVYPVEGHGFTDPASWTDEYRRILALIEERVGR